MRKILASLAWGWGDTFALAGVACVFWGVYQWCPPLAWVVLGLFLVWLGLFSSRG